MFECLDNIINNKSNFELISNIYNVKNLKKIIQNLLSPYFPSNSSYYKKNSKDKNSDNLFTSLFTKTSGGANPRKSKTGYKDKKKDSKDRKIIKNNNIQEQLKNIS